MKQKYIVKPKEFKGMPYEREEVYVKDELIGEIGTALACGPFGNEFWRYCYRANNEKFFDFDKGFIFYGKHQPEVKITARDKAINALLKMKRKKII